MRAFLRIPSPGVYDDAVTLRSTQRPVQLRADPTAKQIELTSNGSCGLTVGPCMCTVTSVEKHAAPFVSTYMFDELLVHDWLIGAVDLGDVTFLGTNE